MKTLKLFLCIACAFSITARIHAEQSERSLTLKLSGYFQGEDTSGNDKAVPFRFTTKEVLNELSFFTGVDLRGGMLLIIDSITDTNVASQIVVRKGTDQVDVTDLFDIDQGGAVYSSKLVADVLKSATLYSIDFFQFQTLNTDTNGLDLQLQLFSRESQRALVKRIGGNQFDVVSSTLAFDGNGELRDQFGLFAPVKGTVKIGSPKYVATPVMATTSMRVMMELQNQSAGTLPPLPAN